MANGEFSGNSWNDNGDGTFSKEGNSGEYLHSDRTESNSARNDNHVHTYPNGEYSMKENGKNSFGSNEANSTLGDAIGSFIGWIMK